MFQHYSLKANLVESGQLGNLTHGRLSLIAHWAEIMNIEMN